MLKEIRASIGKITSNEVSDIREYVMTLVSAREKQLADKHRAGTLAAKDKTKQKKIITLYKELSENASGTEEVREFYNGKIAALKQRVSEEQTRIDNLFTAMSHIFGEESNEMLVLVTELTLAKDSADFFAVFGSASYEKYNELLKVGDRKENLRREILEIMQ